MAIKDEEEIEEEFEFSKPFGLPMNCKTIILGKDLPNEVPVPRVQQKRSIIQSFVDGMLRLKGIDFLPKINNKRPIFARMFYNLNLGQMLRHAHITLAKYGSRVELQVQDMTTMKVW